MFDRLNDPPAKRRPFCAFTLQFEIKKSMCLRKMFEHLLQARESLILVFWSGKSWKLPIEPRANINLVELGGRYFRHRSVDQACAGKRGIMNHYRHVVAC